MSLGPVVSRPRLPKHKVVWSENLTKGSGADGVHRSWFQIDEDCPWHIFATTCLVVVDVDPLQLQIGVTMVGAGGVNPVFIANDLPELCSNLVAALAGLDVDNLPHGAASPASFLRMPH